MYFRGNRATSCCARVGKCLRRNSDVCQTSFVNNARGTHEVASIHFQSGLSRKSRKAELRTLASRWMAHFSQIFASFRQPRAVASRATSRMSSAISGCHLHALVKTASAYSALAVFVIALLGPTIRQDLPGAIEPVTPPSPRRCSTARRRWRARAVRGTSLLRLSAGSISSSVQAASSSIPNSRYPLETTILLCHVAFKIIQGKDIPADRKSEQVLNHVSGYST